MVRCGHGVHCGPERGVCPVGTRWMTGRRTTLCPRMSTAVLGFAADLGRGRGLGRDPPGIFVLLDAGDPLVGVDLGDLFEQLAGASVVDDRPALLGELDGALAEQILPEYHLVSGHEDCRFGVDCR